jgi:nocardicin N-oxygenase
LDDRAITALDPPEHTRLRAVVSPAFTSGRIRKLAPFVSAAARRYVDDLVTAGPPGDFVATVAAPFALEVIGAVLDLPAVDHARLGELTSRYLSVDSHTPEQMRQAVSELRSMLVEHVDRRRREPSDGIVDVLLAGGLADDTIVTFGVTLLVAGYETVVAHLANSLLVLLRHPDQLELLRARPSLIGTAVEELLRFTAISPGGGTLRVAVEDVTVGDSLIRAGEAVLPSTVSANRDPHVFPDPDRFDVRRGNAGHLAFGHGVHRCLGAALARLELRTLFNVLLARVPDIRLAVDEGALEWNRHKMIRGVSALPLAW